MSNRNKKANNKTNVTNAQTKSSVVEITVPDIKGEGNIVGTRTGVMNKKYLKTAFKDGIILPSAVLSYKKIEEEIASLVGATPETYRKVIEDGVRNSLTDPIIQNELRNIIIKIQREERESKNQTVKDYFKKLKIF